MAIRPTLFDRIAMGYVTYRLISGDTPDEAVAWTVQRLGSVGRLRADQIGRVRVWAELGIALAQAANEADPRDTLRSLLGGRQAPMRDVAVRVTFTHPVTGEYRTKVAHVLWSDTIEDAVRTARDQLIGDSGDSDAWEHAEYTIAGPLLFAPANQE